MGNYNFENIVFYAKKRFVEGYNTIDLLISAKSDREKEEIALVSLLNIADDEVQSLKLSCKHNATCKAVNCREKLKKIINKELSFLEDCEYSYL